VTVKRVNPLPDDEFVPACVRLFVAFLIVLVATLATIVTFGSIPVVGLSLYGAWRLAKRVPKMGPPLVFMVGCLVVLLIAYQAPIWMPHCFVQWMPESLLVVTFYVVVPLAALLAIVWIGRWAWRPRPTLEVAETKAEPPKGGDPSVRDDRAGRS